MALDLKEKSTEKDQLEQVLEKQDELETKDVENEILEDVKEIVNQKELSVDQMAQAVVKVVMNKKEVYAGPIPHPDHLRQYEEIVEGSADRLIKMAENQSEHRRNQEDNILNAEIKNVNRGQIFGFILLMTCLIGGFILIAFDKNGMGIAAIITAVAGFALSYFYGKKS